MVHGLIIATMLTLIANAHPPAVTPANTLLAGAIIGKSPATPSLVECREWADKYLWARHEYPWLIHALVDPTFSMFSFAVCRSRTHPAQSKRMRRARRRFLYRATCVQAGPSVE
jgi:hypothetical protein